MLAACVGEGRGACPRDTRAGAASGILLPGPDEAAADPADCPAGTVASATPAVPVPPEVACEAVAPADVWAAASAVSVAAVFLAPALFFIMGVVEVETATGLDLAFFGFG